MRQFWWTALNMMVLVAMAQSAMAASFFDLSLIDESVGTRPATLSADGRIVYGRTMGSHVRSFQWEIDKGARILPTVGGEEANGMAPIAATADGGALIGDYNDASGTRHVFRWTQRSGTVLLDDALDALPFGITYAGDISGDGNTILGRIYFGSSSLPPFVISEGGAAELLPFGNTSIARMSRDGSTYLVNDSGGGGCVSCLVDADTLATTSLDGNVGFPIVSGRALSKNGGVVTGVGYPSAEATGIGFWWSKDEGTREIAIDGYHAQPFSVSADGTTVVGQYESDGPENFAGGFIWNKERGASDVWSLLKSDPTVDVGGFTSIRYVSAVADDGLTVVGQGWKGESTTPRAFRAYLGVGQTLGDTDDDGDVDLADLNNVRNNFGGAGLGDTEGNGTVDLADLNNVRNHFGESVPVGNPVPEPAAFGMTLVALVSLVAWRRKHRQR